MNTEYDPTPRGVEIADFIAGLRYSSEQVKELKKVLDKKGLEGKDRVRILYGMDGINELTGYLKGTATYNQVQQIINSLKLA